MLGKDKDMKNSGDGCGVNSSGFYLGTPARLNCTSRLGEKQVVLFCQH